MSLSDKAFDDSLKAWNESSGNSTTPIWGRLAKKHGFKSAEALRSAFKRERKKRGISKNGLKTAQQSPRIGIFDLETLPLRIAGYMWRIHDAYISHDMIKQNWSMVSWAGKILGEDGIYSDVMTPKEAVGRNTARIAQSAREFMDSLDIVIWHNGDSFDNGILTYELTLNGLKPLKYKSIDTYKLIKWNYTLPSYKLDYVNALFGIRKKIANEGMPLWIACSEGDPEALKTMLNYNEGDIFSNEDLFRKISPYCNTGLPNLATYYADGTTQVCNHCGSKLVRDSKHPHWNTNTARYERFVCPTDGSVYRGRKTLFQKQETSGLLVSL